MKAIAYAILANAAFAAPPAFAAEFLASVGSGGGGTPGCGGVTSGVVNAPTAREQVCVPVGPGLVDGQAAATFGHVGGTTNASHTGGYFGTAFGISTASMFSDFVTFTSADPLATTTTIAANLAFSGALNTTLTGNAFASIRWSMDAVGNAIAEVSDNSGVSNPGFTIVSGTLSGASSDALLRTATFIAPLNQPLRLTLLMDTGAGVAGGTFEPQSASARFSNSFEVPLGMDAFVLTTGVTANSGSWLVNNRRVGPTTGAVPEPSSWMMLIIGFGLIGVAIRRAPGALRRAHLAA